MLPGETGQQRQKRLFDDAHPDDTFDAFQVIHDGLGGAAIQIQHGVGELAPALVHQAVDVDILTSNGGGEAAQRVGDVPVSQALTPAMVIWAVVFALLAIPLLYRFRLDQYIIIDKPGIGAVAALRESRKLMRGNCISFFLLDVKQWYYYLAMAIASAVSYGSVLLAALGLELPLPGIAVYLIFMALYLALTFLVYRFLRGQVETVYALAYDSIRPEEKQDGAVLGNIFRM